MTLPLISTPEFNAVIPSTGKEIRFRPFLIREEKVLLIAVESKDRKSVFNAIEKILKDCILDEDVDVRKLSTFDVEYLFLQLRSKSVGENVKLSVEHGCNHKNLINIQLDQLNVDMTNAPNLRIDIGNGVGIQMRYPTIKDLYTASVLNSTVEQSFKLMSLCIDYVYDQEKTYSEFSEKEIIEWIETLNKSQFKKLNDFVVKLPKVSCKIDYTCQGCGEKDQKTIEGLESFFT